MDADGDIPLHLHPQLKGDLPPRRRSVLCRDLQGRLGF